MAGIFICYRREDSAATCGRIYDRLVQHYGKDAVFKDVDSIPLGADFPAYILRVMARCDVQLVVIGPTWLSITDPDGQRRLDNPHDFIRLEIEAAAQQRLTTIPLLVQGATIPAVDRLPPSLRFLAQRNGMPVRYDPDFDGDMRRLFVALDHWVLSGRVAPPGTDQRTTETGGARMPTVPGPSLEPLPVSSTPLSKPSPNTVPTTVRGESTAPASLPRIGRRKLLIGAGVGVGAMAVAGGAILVRNAQGTGGDGGKKPLAGPRLLWRYHTAASIVCAPVVNTNVVYVGSEDANLYALNAENGAKLWSSQTRGRIVGTPAVANGVVYFGSEDHNIYVVRASDGRQIWKYVTSDNVDASPLVANGLLYVAPADHYLYAFETGSFNLRWKFRMKASYNGSPELNDGTVYIGSGDHTIYALDANTGTLRWHYVTAAGVYAKPTILDGNLYVRDSNGILYALRADTGTLQWQYATGNMGTYQVAAFNGTVYVDAASTYLLALNTADASVRWKVNIGGYGFAPLISDPLLYVGADDGPVYGLRLADGGRVWTFDTAGSVVSSPALVNGVLFIASVDSSVYAVSV